MIQYNAITIKPGKELKLQKTEVVLFFYPLYSHFTISPIKQNDVSIIKSAVHYLTC